MTSEFTYYALFVMLTISVGVIVQFFLGSIRKLNKDIKKINQSINNIHSELYSSRDRAQKPAPKVIYHQGKTSLKNRTLRGDLELEYQGSRAITSATFRIDKDT